MSSRSAATLGQTRELIIILLVALSVPLIVQFFVYILASATGATLSGCGLRDSRVRCHGLHGERVSSLWLPAALHSRRRCSPC
jgi:hypothetical protein